MRKTGVPYIEYAIIFRRFLEEKGWNGPDDLWEDLEKPMGKDRPSRSAVWEAWYGTRKLPEHVKDFLKERYDFWPGWRKTLPASNKEGIRTKANQLSLPGMRELKK